MEISNKRKAYAANADYYKEMPQLVYANKIWDDFMLFTNNSFFIEEPISILKDILDQLKNRPNLINDTSFLENIDILEHDIRISTVYRHMRDFGSLRNYKTCADDKINKKFLSIYEYIKVNSSSIADLKNYYVSGENIFSEFFDNKPHHSGLIKFLNSVFFPKSMNWKCQNGETLASEIESFLKINLDKTFNAFPESSIKNGGFGKMLRLFIGILLYGYYLPAKKTPDWWLRQIKIAYYFSISHPFIDDVMDSHCILSQNDKIRYAQLIRSSLDGESVSDNIPKVPFILELYRCGSELREILLQQENKGIYDLIRIAHDAQVYDNIMSHTDGIKDIALLYKTIMLKAGYARVSIASLSGYSVNEEFVLDSLVMGLNNQLSNDFEGMTEDKENKIITPYTAYFSGNHQINPFELFIKFGVFASSRQKNRKNILYALCYRLVEIIRKFILINGFEKYAENIKNLVNDSCFYQYLDIFYELGIYSENSTHVHQESSFVSFMDQQAKTFFENRKSSEQKSFDKIRIQYGFCVEDSILGHPNLTSEALYSVSGVCNRFRSFLLVIMAEIYSIEIERLRSLIAAIEYFHTASLILDDLPSQDNANMRRFKPSLHKKYNEFTAQLTAIELISHGYELLSGLSAKFDPQRVNELVAYSSVIARSLCKGQKFDLLTRDRECVGLADLTEISKLKTSSAFEFSIVAIPILIGEDKTLIEDLKLFSEYIGIAFQINDDLKDNKNTMDIGKDSNLDAVNNRETFLSFLGREKAIDFKDTYVNYAKHILNDKLPEKFTTLNFLTF